MTREGVVERAFEPDPTRSLVRLDWRFLLPQPDLDTVAYLRPASSEQDGRDTLLEALRLFARNVETVGPAGAQDAKFDLAVAVGDEWGLATRARGILRPNGFLYVELASRGVLRCWLDRRRLAHRLRQHGFVIVGTYWVWPSFADAEQFVPIDDRAAMEFAVTRQHGSVWTLLKARLARPLARRGWLRVLVPYVSVLARAASPRS